jgi:putative aldouronate transport system permease protein
LNPGAKLPTTPEALRAAQVVLTTLPIIILYPLLQRYFIKGITIGAVKE